MCVSVYIYIYTHTYIYIIESLCCTPETNIVNQLYFNKNFFFQFRRGGERSWNRFKTIWKQELMY